MFGLFFRFLFVNFICFGEILGEFSRNITADRNLESISFRANPRARLIIPHGLPGRALNADQFYRKWPDPKYIPVDIDPAYTFQEQRTIRDAMNQITSDTNGCIQYVPYDPLNRTDFISITPLEDAGSLRYGCWSFPGRVWNQNGRGQLLGITRGGKGCVNNKREIMKVLIHVLGFRMVQNRPDRDHYIRIIYENMAAEWREIDPYRKYSAAQVAYKNLPFDFNSITFHPPTKFSKSNVPVYEILEDVVIGTMDELSRWDCVGIATMYGCNPNSCEDPYDDGGLFPLPVTTELITYTTAALTSPVSDAIPTEPAFPTDGSDSPGTFLTFPSRPTIRPRPNTFPTEPSDFPIFIPTTPVSEVEATRICKRDFKIDTALYSENGKIYIFSGERFWTMDFRGEVLEAGIPISSRFDGRVQAPIIAGWSNGVETVIIDATGQEIITRNERFIRMDPNLFPDSSLSEAFSFNSTTVYYITKNGSQVQIGKHGTPTNFTQFLLMGLGRQISAAFTVPILGSQIIGFVNPNNDFAYVTPCTMNIAPDPSPCFEELPAGGWPLKFNSIISYPAGNCRRRIRLRFPQFRGLK